MNPRWPPLFLALLFSAAPLHAQATTFQYFYDDANELFRVIDSTGTMIEYIYDPAGNITQINRATVTASTPMILNITPLSGSWGDKITIIGQGFSPIAANNIVQINGLTVTVLSATATEIVILIPPNATTGQITVTVGGLTITSGPTLIYTQVPSALNYTTAAIFSVQNGVVPGTIPPPGQNEAPFPIFSIQNGALPGTNPVAGTNEIPFRIFSVLNGSAPGTTLQAGLNEAVFPIFSVSNISSSLPPGLNEAVFPIFSVLNGTVPGVTVAAGKNEAPFRLFSVQNGTIPGAVIPPGSNETDFPLFSVGNSTSNPALRPSQPLTSSTNPATRSATTNKPHILPSRTSAVAGQTIQVAATLDNPAPGATVEFFINGESFGTYAAPWKFPLTAPYTASSLRIKAVTDGVASDETLVAIIPESGLRLQGRIVTADRAPASNKSVNLLYSGLRAELFRFAAPLNEIPDLTGLTPVAVRAVSSLDLRNPSGVFDKDPLATEVSLDFAVRFTASLDIAQDGDYVFSLRGAQGVSLRIAGKPVSDGGKIHLERGLASVEAVAFAGAGAMEVQLQWQPPGQLMQPVPDGVLWVRESGIGAVTDLSGQFEFMAVPSSVGLVKVSVGDAISEAIPATAGNVGVLTVGKAVQ